MKFQTIFLVLLIPSFLSAQHFEYDHLLKRLKLYSPSDPVPTIHFRNTSTTADWILKHDGTKFHIQDETSTGNEKLTILANGNIGVGTISPEEKLHVMGKARIIEMERNITSSSNVVRQVDGTLALRKYQLEDLAHGGIVFWVDQTGEHGLVCTMGDLESTPGDSSHQWSFAFAVTGATAGKSGSGSVDGKGAGAMNTMFIVSADRADTDSAARLCADLIEGGYGDWYLPSLGELYWMWENLADSDGDGMNSGPADPGNLGGFAADLYWTSTEDDDNRALYLGFSNGSTDPSNKTSSKRVRAVRAF